VIGWPGDTPGKAGLQFTPASSRPELLSADNHQ